MIILAEVLSLLSALILAYSTFSNKKHKMIGLQAVKAIFYGISNLILGGYTAVVTNILILIRNVLEINNKMNKITTILICVLMIGIGLYFNNNALLGLLPIVASVQYTICIYVLKSAQQMRFALMISLFQWLFFDFFIHSYPMFVMDLITIVITLINIFRYKATKENNVKKSTCQ